MNRNSRRKIRAVIAVLLTLTLVFGMSLMRQAPSSAQVSYQSTLRGFGANQQGNGNLNLGWTTGNLGNTWNEGEWVPYTLELNGLQTNYPGLAGLPDLEITYDFFKIQGQSNARFIDLVRAIQAGPAMLGNNQGWPQSDGSPFPMGTRDELEVAQNAYSNVSWPGFEMLNLPNDQINRALDGGLGGPQDQRRKIVIKASDLIEAGFANADTIVIYFQLHESRSFIWQNSLQEGYDASPTDVWGGYLYSQEPFKSDARLGSGHVPGSAGHVALLGGGQKTVPIPLPSQEPGTVFGTKFLDSNANGTRDPGEPGIENWPIFVSGEVDGIQFTQQTLTDSMGNYSFENLTSGTIWRISEGLQPEGEENGYFQTYPFEGAANVGQAVAVAHDVAGQADMAWDVTLTLAQPNQQNVNFGNAQAGEIKVVKEDTEGVELEGWKFTLFKFNEEAETEEEEWEELGEAVTEKHVDEEENESIFALFTDLKPGTYKLVETLQDGYDFFNPNDGVMDDIVLQAGEKKEVTFVNLELSEIKVVKEDTEGVELEGWKFTLFKFNEEAETEEEEWEELGEAVTEKHVDEEENESIFALFTDLKPGTYKLVETLQDGYDFFNPDDGVMDDIILQAGEKKEVTFVNVELGEVKIIKEDLEGSPLSGWEFTLYKFDENAETEDEEWVEEDKQTTDDNGEVIFKDLLPGRYKVVEEERDGWIIVSPVSGEVEIILSAGGSEEKTFVNTPAMDCFEETAWAFGGEGIAMPFTDWGFSNWGWTNKITEGEYTFDLIAGAGNNVITNGVKVGEVEVIFSGGFVTVTYNMIAPYELAEAHLHIGTNPLPLKQQGQNIVMTNAPGQFEFNGNVVEIGHFEEDEIYIAAHAVAVIPCEEEVAISVAILYESEEVFFMTLTEFNELDEEKIILEEEENQFTEVESFNDEMKEPEEEIEEDQPENDNTIDDPKIPDDEEAEEGGRPENPGGRAPGRNR